MKPLVTKSVAETIALGARLGSLLSGGEVIALRGELGSGKTTFVKGIADGIGVGDTRYVNSPSFVIVKEYAGRVPLYHFDIYRLDGPADLDTVNYKELFYGGGATVIEWADKIKELLPEEYLEIGFAVKGNNERRITIAARGKRYEALLRRL